MKCDRECTQQSESDSVGNLPTHALASRNRNELIAKLESIPDLILSPDAKFLSKSVDTFVQIFV